MVDVEFPLRPVGLLIVSRPHTLPLNWRCPAWLYRPVFDRYVPLNVIIRLTRIVDDAPILCANWTAALAHGLVSAFDPIP